eukprot:7880545-Ditylum_brightwellii.AAC.1
MPSVASSVRDEKRSRREYRKRFAKAASALPREQENVVKQQHREQPPSEKRYAEPLAPRRRRIARSPA